MRGEWLREPSHGVSVVFVHGILSNGETCWKHENGAYWPELLKNEAAFEGMGIYVYTYETGIFSGTYSLNDVVDDLKERFFALDHITDNQRIVFVCHSMGGIVVRKFLLERSHDLLERHIEVGLFLIASPSLGSSYANWLAPLAKLMGHSQADALRFTQSNSWLNGLDKEFQNLKEKRRLSLQGKELVEDKFVVFKRWWRQQVVEPFAGARYFGEPYKVPGSDHFSIAKPENAGAVQHRLLLAFIEKLAGLPASTAQLPAPPSHPQPAAKKVFISYRHAQPDEDLALALDRSLLADGHQVFIDRRIKLGSEWNKEIDQHLRGADVFVMLLSAESIRSDMVRQEILLAHELKQRGSLRILPIRVGFSGALPYDLGSYLNPLQYALWETNQPTAAITEQIRLAVAEFAALPIAGHAEEETDTPAQIQALEQATEQRGAPLPQADPRVLELAMERGAMRCDSPFYLRRPDDDEMDRQLRCRGVTVIVKGARQMGKSSLLIRAMAQAKALGQRTCFVDFQLIDAARLASLDSLLLFLTHRLARDLRLSTRPEDYWDDNLGAKICATDFIQDAVLAGHEQPVAWYFDEVDRVFQYPYRMDFFALLRAWTTQRANPNTPEWERFNLILAHSTDPVLWIDDINQSPFNVGKALVLHDFDRAGLADLGRRYATPIADAHLDDLYALLGGHPYLTRQALYELASGQTAWEKLQDSAAKPDGPFGDHLRRLSGILINKEPLRKAVLQILQNRPCEDELSFQRLYAAGLVVGETRHAARLRCRLYKDYFRNHL